ncbi:MAG: hypothetical protein LBR11_13095 [Deltaproteobacteria bacterium]|jgi:hypothetical protein|nr:hypothetical protein [Deltaproteobacteria bacterium]
MKNLPLSIQNLTEIIKGDYLYVDKTDLVPELIKYKQSPMGCNSGRESQKRSEVFESYKIVAELTKIQKDIFNVLNLDVFF